MRQKLLTGDAIKIHLKMRSLGIYRPMSMKQDPAISQDHHQTHQRKVCSKKSNRSISSCI